MANASFALPLVVWLLAGFLRGVPVELEEAGVTRRAGRLATIPVGADTAPWPRGACSALLLTSSSAGTSSSSPTTFTAPRRSTVPCARPLPRRVRGALGRHRGGVRPGRCPPCPRSSSVIAPSASWSALAGRRPPRVTTAVLARSRAPDAGRRDSKRPPPRGGKSRALPDRPLLYNGSHVRRGGPRASRPPHHTRSQRGHGADSRAPPHLRSCLLATAPRRRTRSGSASSAHLLRPHLRGRREGLFFRSSGSSPSWCSSRRPAHRRRTRRGQVEVGATGLTAALYNSCWAARSSDRDDKGREWPGYPLVGIVVQKDLHDACLRSGRTSRASASA